MRLLTEIKVLTALRITIAKRNPIFLIMGLATPILYLTLFMPILKNLSSFNEHHHGNLLTYFVPGMLPIIAFSTGIFTGFGMINEVRSGILERLKVTPASRFSILSGPVLFDTCAMLFNSLLFTLIAIPFGFRAHLLGMGVLFVLLSFLTLITSSIGNALAVCLKSHDRYAPIVHGINLPVLLLSGTLLPIAIAPLWLKIIAHLNPVFYVVEASRALAVGNFSSPSVFLACIILTSFAALSLSWATKVFKSIAA